MDDISLYITMGRSYPIKTARSHGDLDPIWFPGPTRVHNPKGMSISSAVFARLMIVTDRPTDGQTTLLRH